MPYNRKKVYYIEGEWGGKVCSVCGWFRNWWEFHNKKSGFNKCEPKCKKCCAEYYLDNRENKLEYSKGYYLDNIEDKIKYSKKYYIKKKEDIAKYKKEYRVEKKEYIIRYKKEHYLDNRNSILEQHKEYYLDNKEDILKQKKEYAASPALFNTFSHQLTIEESPRETEDRYLEVKCANSGCRNYFIPTTQQVQNRIQALKGNLAGEHRLYCSEKCKNECSLFNRSKYPKGFKTKPNGTEFPKFVRNQILKRDNHKCQICGETHRLQAHHIYPGSTHPMLSNDVDNGITLCKKCHKKVHKLPGCGLHELAACSQRIKQDLNDKGIDPHEIPDWAVDKYMDKY